MYASNVLDLAEAKAIGEAALAEAAKDPARPVAIAVSDANGTLVYFVRQDRASAHYAMLAISKAYTSARCRRDTALVKEQVARLGGDLGAFVDSQYTTLPGGMCLRTKDGTVVGGVGVSGRTIEDKIQDVDIVKAGLKAFNPA
ncbi:MAG: heme-binding protein [Chloroflexi bacterium]|nr:heme-binding protein [Chloroflexota bacterium]